ncbi:hypothetical protein EDC01DRAFT_664123 [Geopyxis carbonaria]|nr:hypothetical protein EDC01DRAFT_664123 [Geopyxis carbonaria]
MPSPPRSVTMAPSIKCEPASPSSSPLFAASSPWPSQSSSESSSQSQSQSQSQPVLKQERGIKTDASIKGEPDSPGSSPLFAPSPLPSPKLKKERGIKRQRTASPDTKTPVKTPAKKARVKKDPATKTPAKTPAAKKPATKTPAKRTPRRKNYGFGECSLPQQKQQSLTEFFAQRRGPAQVLRPLDEAARAARQKKVMMARWAAWGFPVIRRKKRGVVIWLA